MAVGYPVTAAEVNAKAGQLVTNLWDALDQVRRFNLWLTDSLHTDNYFNSLGITGTSSSGDLQVLKSSFADLAGATGLYGVAHGTVTPSGASDYFFNARQLTGTNYTG